MYTQEMIDAISANQTAYLYTEAGELTPKMRQTDAEVIEFGGSSENGLLSRFIGSLSLPYSDLSNELKEKLHPTVKLVRNGLLEHINEHVDVLITHDLVDDMILSNLVDVPVIRIYHGIEQTGIGTQAHELLSTSYSVVNSIQTRKELVENLGHTPTGIAYPGVDSELFNPAVTPAFERDERTVLFVGRFIPGKGVFDLIDAVAQISEDIHLHLIGRGDRGALMERIDTYGLESAVTIDESVPHDELPGYYTAADVVCLPSHYESFGMVNLEAMACGTPVVTTDLPGITEYAFDRETAMVVPPKQPDELAKSIGEVLSMPDLRTRLSENGRAIAKRYSWERSATDLVNTCLNVVDDSQT
ncbi:glycosyltransferase family 4 protein [Haladaptatus sp. DFWS20]|uniref:glycosyltransferase family 4 protein n=1 Tax=Haladaptatus sp. DFWS20 TaxID=3403467 RepID=UPI003EBF2FD5